MPSIAQEQSRVLKILKLVHRLCWNEPCILMTEPLFSPDNMR